jgi:hypothetical protein
VTGANENALDLSGDLATEVRTAGTKDVNVLLSTAYHRLAGEYDVAFSIGRDDDAARLCTRACQAVGQRPEADEEQRSNAAPDSAQHTPPRAALLV